MEALMSRFGELLREHRFAKNWNQSLLAHQISTSQTQVSAWETGREDFGSWAVNAFFDKLLELFDYPEDLLTWWVERELTEIEKTISKAHTLKEQASRRARPMTVLARLDQLIDRNRTEHAELTALRAELKSMFHDDVDQPAATESVLAG
jgi:transcriptional regulator with XRE-family HTH domain